MYAEKANKALEHKKAALPIEPAIDALSILAVST